jgi:hypothetical protein
MSTGELTILTEDTSVLENYITMVLCNRGRLDEMCSKFNGRKKERRLTTAELCVLNERH